MSTVVEPSNKAQEWARGERLAGCSVSRNWVRKHFGDVTGMALRNARREPVLQSEKTARWINRQSEARWAAR
jgi:hypothetical protein